MRADSRSCGRCGLACPAIPSAPPGSFLQPYPSTRRLGSVGRLSVALVSLVWPPRFSKTSLPSCWSNGVSARHHRMCRSQPVSQKRGRKGRGRIGLGAGRCGDNDRGVLRVTLHLPPLTLFSPLKEGVGGDDGWMKVVGDFAVPAGRCGTQTCGKAEKTSDASPGPPARNRGTTPEPPGRARSRPRGVRRVRDGLSPE